jgi:hypothetical protein
MLDTGDPARIIEDCMIAAAWVKAESVVTDTPELYKVVNVSSPFRFLNGIFRTQLSADSSEQRVHELRDEFARQKIPFRWYHYDHSSPASGQMEKLRPIEVVQMTGLRISTEQNIDSAKGVTVEEVVESNLEDYIAANLAGWQVTGDAGEKVRQSIRADFHAGQSYRSFLARVDGRPATTGLLRFVNGVGYLQGGSTDPALRGRGAYRALVAHRLKEALKQGVKFAYVNAIKRTSAPVLLDLGFEQVCESRSFEFAFY